ncbi:MAG: hypothetical protein A2511_06575 [Deltaproteobacteria bacterium RIFOXYD12_FULL_50_9]|nr:MAG: hypothetical protein A2511_06575 [Deltaproteobacteria bacterium RIFOXYD12_FULL_50_9]
MAGCGTHYYENLTKEKIDLIINALKNDGATVIGNNPWDADTVKSGVKLRGEYNETTMTLAVTVTDRDWYVPCSMVWEKLDSLMHHIQGIPDTKTEQLANSAYSE